MGKWKKNIPEGTRDILFKDCADKKFIEETLKGVYLNRGFVEVITPTLEFYDVFDSDNMWIDQEKMYKLFDNKGRILVLRPDITTPVARLVGTKLKDSYYPLKLCYCENVFRVNENLNGQRNEFTQSGIEIIGCSELRADVEVISTAVKTLLEAGLENFKVELGQAEFFKGIMEELDLVQGDKEKIRKFIENKSFGSLRDFLQDKEKQVDKKNIDILNSLPALFGDISIIERARKLTDNEKALEALVDIEKIYRMLESMGISQYISLDLGMVHHIDYYTGLIFRGYIEGAGVDVLYGGRYDGLASNFGVKVPATGFAINIDAILEVLKRQEVKISDSINPQYLIHCSCEQLGKANIMLEDIIQRGFKCEISLFSHKDETLQYAKKRKIQKILFLDEEESYQYNIEGDSIEKLSLAEEIL